MPEIRDTRYRIRGIRSEGKVLKDLIEHHAEEEERQMFPKARKVMGVARLRDLGQELQGRKRELTAEMSEGGMDTMTRRRRRATFYTVRPKIA